MVAENCIGDFPIERLSTTLINAVFNDVAFLIVHRLETYLIVHYFILFSFITFVGYMPIHKSITLPEISRNIQRQLVVL